MTKLNKKQLNNIMEESYHICREEDIKQAVYEKSFVVYSFDKDLKIEDINKVLKDMNVSTRELTEDEVIYHI